jgi:hypothetical protein
MVVAVRRALIGSALVAAGWLATNLVARHGVTYREHTLRRTEAKLEPALATAVAEAIDRTPPRTLDDARALALDLTGRSLRFGLAHHTSLRFDLPPRRAHCVEYAHLYAALFERVAKGIGGRAWVVHSADARVLGARLPIAGLRDHDWVLVEVGGSRRLIDPSFDDLGLGWDAEGRVIGRVR